jgi:hypothetical protein
MFWSYVVEGLGASLLFFYAILRIYEQPSNDSSLSVFSLGMVAQVSIVVVVNLRLCLDVTNWTVAIVGIFVATFVVFFLSLLMFQEVSRAGRRRAGRVRTSPPDGGRDVHQRAAPSARRSPSAHRRARAIVPSPSVRAQTGLNFWSEWWGADKYIFFTTSFGLFALWALAIGAHAARAPARPRRAAERPGGRTFVRSTEARRARSLASLHMRSLIRRCAHAPCAGLLPKYIREMWGNFFPSDARLAMETVRAVKPARTPKPRLGLLRRGRRLPSASASEDRDVD